MTTPSTNIELFNSSNFIKPVSEENKDKINSNLRSINANQQAIIANVSSISANSASVTAEVARAQAAESTLTTNLNAEITRAQGAESTNASAISAETTRAQGAESTLTTNVTALQSSDATNTSAIATLQSANTSNQSAIATLQSSNASNASAISTEESRAQGAENTLTTNVTALQTANTTNTSAISTLESMIGTWDYATYGTLATYVLTLQSGGGGGGTSYTTYNVKVVTNVLNQNVYSIQAPSSNFYTQPVLSFGAGDQFLFDIQDATYSAANAALVFGTTADIAGTINTAVVSTVNNNILLTIDSAYSGSNLVYFDSGTANMGYVAPPSGTTYTVTVANGVYSFASGGSTVTPTFTNGTTYIFDLADATNTGQQFVLGSTLDDTSTVFSTQTIMGTPGQTGAYVSYTISNFNAVAYFSYTTTGMGATISQADYEYIVKTVTNVTGDVVYAFDTNGDGTFYNQPDLTFAVGSKYLFQTSQIASGYTLSFGTTVDGTPDTSVVTSGTNQLLLDLTAQTGDHYTYFDTTNAGMGYVDSTPGGLASFLANSVLTGWFSQPAGTFTYSLTGNSNSFANGDYEISANESTNGLSTNLHHLLNSGSSGYPGYDWFTDGYWTNGSYTGSGSTTAGSTSYSGQWVQLDMPYSMVITQMNFRSRGSGFDHMAPGTFDIFGSNNAGSSFTHLLSTNLTYTGTNYEATITFSGITTAYSTYRISCDTLVTTGGSVIQSEYWGLTGNVFQSTSPYVVTVANGVFNIDGVAQPTLTFTSGNTYAFDQSDSSNAGHPLVIGTTADDNTTLVTQTVVGTPGQAGAYTEFTATATTVYYFCYNHSGMGA